jgi:hypothetical protein
MTSHPSDRFALVSSLVSSLVTPLDADDLEAVAVNSEHNRGFPSRPQSPPGGAPLQRNRGQLNGAGSGNRTGRRREFGLRAIIR